MQFRSTLGSGTIGNYVEFDDITVIDQGDIFLSALADQSGNGHHLTQTIGSKQPAYIDDGSGPNGLPYLLFNGITQFLKASWLHNQPHTTFVVFKPSLAAAVLYFFDGGIYQRGTFYKTAASNALRIYAGGVVTGSAMTSPATWQYATAVFNGASSSLSLDGGVPTTGNAGASNPDGLTVGASANGSLCSAISALEVIRYSGVKSAGDIATVEAYIKSRYGL